MWTVNYVAFFYFVKSLCIIRFLKNHPLEEQVLNIFTFKMFPLHLCKLFIRHLCLHSKRRRTDYSHRPEQRFWLGGAVLCTKLQVKAGAVRLMNLIEVDADPATATNSWLTCFFASVSDEWKHLCLPPTTCQRDCTGDKCPFWLRSPHILPLCHSLAYYHWWNCTQHPALHSGIPFTAGMELPLSVLSPRSPYWKYTHT